MFKLWSSFILQHRFDCSKLCHDLEYCLLLVEKQGLLDECSHNIQKYWLLLLQESKDIVWFCIFYSKMIMMGTRIKQQIWQSFIHSHNQNNHNNKSKKTNNDSIYFFITMQLDFFSNKWKELHSHRQKLDESMSWKKCKFCICFTQEKFILHTI
jgi:hypothetical protein